MCIRDRVNKTYLINSDIPSVRHTHNSKSHKMTHVKHLRHNTYGDTYHCRYNKKRSKLSRRNTTQNCCKYDGKYTPVSYTHLDVYKRQGPDRVGLLGPTLQSLPTVTAVHTGLFRARCCTTLAAPDGFVPTFAETLSSIGGVQFRV